MARRMSREVVFLTLVLPLLHLAQATTCQGDNCPTGLIITGGYGDDSTSIETFPAATCTIPPFPQGRTAHTLSVVDNGRQLVVCGGFDTENSTSCISWRSGQDDWTHYATLSQERWGHAAVSINDKIILVGGYSMSSSKSGEIVGEDGTQFALQNGAWAGCAVPYQTGFITIGGCGVGCGGIHGKVDRYDSEGKYLDSLPDLATPRALHACTSFFTNGEQALLVAGGNDFHDPLAFTEIYSNGVWRTGGNLPRAMTGLRAAHLNQQVVLTGASDGGSNFRDEVLQYNVEAGTWTQIGKLQMKRNSHAIADANLGALGCIQQQDGGQKNDTVPFSRTD